jgi:hypothetical protein
MSPAKHKNLHAFGRWVLSQGFASLRPPADGLRFVRTADFKDGEIAAGIVLARDPPYQAELFLVTPNSSLVSHSHPNVDSFEVYVTGDVHFDVNGKAVETVERVESLAEDGASFLNGAWFRIRSGMPHGGRSGKNGGAFISIQKWKNGVEPTSVVEDWDGPAHR